MKVTLAVILLLTLKLEINYAYSQCNVNFTADVKCIVWVPVIILLLFNIVCLCLGWRCLLTITGLWVWYCMSSATYNMPSRAR